MNFLEQLSAEWYTYQGYFVRTNVKTNKRAKGGWDNELDVLAFSAQTGELVHIESTWDAESWPKRKERFLTKKFVYSQAQYEDIVGTKISKLHKIALVGLVYATKSDLSWGGGIEVYLIPKFIASIARELEQKDPLKDVVPEGFPRLRAMQLALVYGRTV
jgi:hypothetical protein